MRTVWVDLGRPQLLYQIVVRAQVPPSQEVEDEDVCWKRQWCGQRVETEETSSDGIIASVERSTNSVTAKPNADRLTLGAPPVGVGIQEAVQLDDQPGLLLDFSPSRRPDIFVPLDVAAGNAPGASLGTIAALNK